ncbi:MAG: hypothetical protein JWO41_860 [Candidatus Saccharibacteria bacterium]|nr:hypothetical protein [Candidatus Saccharibacteria bacterium]
MTHKRQIVPIMRAVLVVAAVAVVTGGVTFAGLQSQQSKLTGNVIQTATANLQVSNDGTTYSNSQTGFVFANLIPGGQAMPSGGFPVYLKNAGGTPLSLKLAVSSPPSNPDNADLSKVNVILKLTTGQSQTFSMQSLIDSSTTGGATITSPSQLNPNVVSQYTLQIQMASDAVTGPSATIGNIDFSFSGTAVTN